MEKSILLIAYKFPPFAGVGGFRWAKLSKYLAERGYKIHVITVKWRNLGSNTNQDDIDSPNIIIHRIPSSYFHNYKYKKYPSNLFGGLKKIVRFGLLNLLNIIWYEDEAQYWGYNMIPYCKKIIEKEGIKTVIATGHPFMVNYWAAKLKSEIPKIKLIQDIQDPWNDDPSHKYYLATIKKRSESHERYALNNCDVLFTVTSGLLERLSDRIVNPVEKIVLPNGYDLTGLEQIPTENRDFSFIYAGNLFEGREEPLSSFLNVVDDIIDNIPEMNIEIYGYVDASIEKHYNRLFEKGHITISNPISPQEILRHISKSFVCLQFNARKYPYLVSTKIYEYGALKRPTLSINYGGEIDKLIKEHNLGISTNGDNYQEIKDSIFKLYDLWKSNPSYEIETIKLEDFSYRNLSKEVEKYLQ